MVASPRFQQRAIERFLQSGSGKIGLVITIVLLSIALFVPIVRPIAPALSQDVLSRLVPPSLMHPFGTDGLGRDLLTLVLHGIRTSLLVSLVAVGVGAIVGMSLGLIAGYFRGWLEILIGWITDILLAFPSILLAIVIATITSTRSEFTFKLFNRVIASFATTNPLQSVIVAIAIVQIPIYIRLTRSVVLSLREQEFIQAAKALGATPSWIILRHILPGSLTPIVVQATLSIGTATLEAAGLGFLGLGAQPPTPELGTMLSDAFRGGYSFTSPWTTIFPGVVITLIVLAFNLLGDGLRDALDPRAQ